jgi:methionine-rich copper-binding protein CopC
MRSLFLALAAPAAILVAAPAMAHSRLVSATPAADATVPATNRLQLTFSEPLVAAFSGVEVDMIDMPGMKMKTPMKMPLQTSVAADGKTLVVALSKPLPRGTYKLDWHVVSTDTHRVTGTHQFKIR